MFLMLERLFDRPELVLDGVIEAQRYGDEEEGKQFLGAVIRCSDGREWVIDYEEQSPFHLFANRRVVARGVPFNPNPKAQIVGATIGGRKIEHFHASTVRLAESTCEVEFDEIGPQQRLSGEFAHFATVAVSKLTFTTDRGDTFLVANTPAGARPGRVEVVSYPLLLSQSQQKSAAKYRWIICPYSAADLWLWRREHM